MIAIMFHELIEMPGTERVFDEGAVLFSRNDVVSSLMLVLSGEVRLVRHQDDGRAVVLQRASAGSILAEASMFSDVYHCDAVAVAVSRVRIIESRRIRLKFASEPKFAAAWAAYLAHEIRNTRMRAEILALKTVAERLDAWITWHEQLPSKGKWRYVAEEIGVSPEAFYRELAKRCSKPT